MELTSTHFVTEQNDPTAPRFSEREMAILDSLLETERRLTVAREALINVCQTSSSTRLVKLAKEALDQTAPKQ